MIPLFKVFMAPEASAAAAKVLESGYIGQGPKVDEFERAAAPWVGSPNCVAVNSCTSALRLAMRLAGVGPGTDVVSTSMSCMASNSPILEQFADVVWADVDPWTGNVDPLDVERKIGPRTRAVVAVHWGGYPCDIDDLVKVCRRHGVALVEDAAHAFGSEYRGRPVGSHLSLACFSFQAIKVLTSVEGGLLVCPSMDSYREARLLRWYGIDRETPRRDLRCEEDAKSAGYKYNFNDVHAAVGLANLVRVGGLLERARANAKFYDAALDGLKRVKRLRYAGDRLSSYWLYTVRVADRESFQRHMAAAGVMVSQVHVRNDVHTAFGKFRRNLPGVDEFAREQVSIPCGWWVGDEDRDKIVAAVRAWDAS